MADNNNSNNSDSDDEATHLTESELLKKFLLGSRLYDTVALEDFEGYFSSKYKGSKRIRKLYTEVTKTRRNLRLAVNANINTSFPHSSEGSSPQQAGNEGDTLAGVEIAHAINILKQLDDNMDAETNELEEECETLNEEIESLNAILNDKSIASILAVKVDTTQLQMLTKKLNGT